MYNKKMIDLGETRSVIRDLSEYGSVLAEKIGKENVFDFTIGNPSVPTPKAVNQNIADLALTDTTVHSYTPAQGLRSVREKIATQSRNNGINISAEHIYLTSGASAALAISIRAVVCEEQDEVVLLAPYFPEYSVFVGNANGKAVIVPADEKNFQIDFDALEKALNKRTAAVIVNSPNNPSGVVYSQSTLQKLADTLSNAEKRFNTTILLISDEPYREIVFDAPFKSPLLYYKHSALCYSYSKSFSLPGERIGYLALSDTLTNVDEFYSAVCGAGRSLGYICAPSIFQKVVENCLCEGSNISPYRKNRDILVAALTELGFNVVNPQGAFYVLVKAPNGDGNDFVNVSKTLGILFVPTDSFGLNGYVRVATCVSTEMLERSLPMWKKLADLTLQK